ncbi:MAG: efflux RND transporter periplasmic adaptor subunit [Phycisphaeraceae bacterium]
MNTPPVNARLRPKFFPLAAIALYAALLVPFAHAQEGGPPPALVRVGEAELQEVRQRRLIVGQVEPGRRSSIAAEEPGRVLTSPPDPGIAVKKGEVLTSVDTILLELDIDAAESTIRRAEASVEEADAVLKLSTRERERTEQLYEQNVARKKELEDAIDRQSGDMARRRAAEATLQRYRSELARLEQRLEKSRIIAPFDAYVVRKQTEVGQWVAAGEAVAEIVELNIVKVRLQVPESMIARIPHDELLPLQIEALNETMHAKLFSIVPDADQRSRNFTVMVHLPNPDGRIKPGMSVRSQLPTGEPMQAMTVPRDAVQTTPSGTVVFVNRNGVAAAVPVRVQFGSGDRFVLDETSLQDGEQVVVQGNERLAPGQPLRIVEDPAEDPSGTAEASDDNAADL